jgi:two-component system response regulator YesN
MDYRIKEILAKVERDISQPILISDLAVSIHLSVSHLQHLFKRELRTGIIKHVNNLRLEKARRLLEITHLRVKEIRLLVGVKDEAHFLQESKRKFGVTPSRYRANFQVIAETDGR